MKIATRKSLLALWQSEFVKAKLQEIEPSLNIELLELSTKGDVILDTPLAKIGGKNLFIKELENAMHDGLAQISVHSLKDVGASLAYDFKLASICKRETPNDVVVFRGNEKSLNELKQGAKIGTTSLRRQMQLRLIRDDFSIHSLRGNLQTRLKKLKDGEFDAIVLAYAGLKRLNLLDELNYEILDTKIMIPSAGQGAVAIESINDEKVLNLVSKLNCPKTALLCKIERDFTATLNGGCGAPIGINAAFIDDEIICVNAIIGLIDASKIIKMQRKINQANASGFGVVLAKEFIKHGALEILAENEELLKEML
ncbi:hydroxymethylbilane synthase [Campylobacter sp. RM12651]|uniref:hydroxymethylbilane synthase n=1 Tax=Campylobacter sp. RM12651 TaxID=1660079 RepID=UPI001EFA64F8|nr:hydroxymethylbilane synthase [Campylobacter sp. RM12651]ULO03592.1 hydroxymethylbilane synthase [Campylobacter sp. RM12651]